jgi:hypothetical protein
VDRVVTRVGCGPMGALEELVTRSQIQQLAVRYALGVDGKDIDALATLYTDEADKGYGPGPDGIGRFFDHVLRGSHCAIHLIGKHLIEFDSDAKAHGVVYCRAHDHVLDPEHWWDVALAYFDSYERRGDNWLFAERRVATRNTAPSVGFLNPRKGLGCLTNSAPLRPFGNATRSACPMTNVDRGGIDRGSERTSVVKDTP